MKDSITRCSLFVAAATFSLTIAACDSNESPPPVSQNQGVSMADAVQQSAGEQGVPQGMQDSPHLFDSEAPLGSAKAVVPFAQISVEKAEGENAYTVGEVFAERLKLNGETIKVRGQVVKFSPAIMDRNFIHLQDGSGVEENKTHNLVITSQQQVSPGDVVTFSGVLTADRDFGAGYTYEAILEEATLVE